MDHSQEITAVLKELENIAAWIRAAHDPKAIAKAAGLSVQTVRSVGVGTYSPTMRTLEKLAKVKATPPPRQPPPPPAW